MPMATGAEVGDRRVQHDLDVRRNEEAREVLALRRLGRRLDAEARLLDRRLRELDERHERAARWLEAEYRRTHFNKSPASWQRRTPSREDAVLNRHTRRHVRRPRLARDDMCLLRPRWVWRRSGQAADQAGDEQRGEQRDDARSP
jgi:hypothetical protein